MNQGNGYAPLFPDKDIVPDVHVPPPLTSQSEALLRDKLPLVGKITAAYQTIGVPTFGEPIQYKQVTPWVYGLLFTMSHKSLEMLANDPSRAESICDSAENFVKLFSEHSVMKQNYKAPDVYWMPDSSKPMKTYIRSRDKNMCVLTAKIDCLDLTYIARFNLGASAEATALLRSLFRVVDALYGQGFSDRAWRLLQSTAVSADWNILTINAYLSTLYDKSFIALRPLALTKKTLAPGVMSHVVHFSLHWLPETVTNPLGQYNNGAPHDCDEDLLRGLLAEHPEYAENRRARCDGHAETGRPLYEGQEFCVAHNTCAKAESMYIMLVLRWTVDMALCLAGGVGMKEAATTPEDGEDF